MATTTYGSPYVQSSDLVSGWPTVSSNVADRIDDVAKNGNGINAQTGTTYTFVLLDTGKIVTASNAASSTYTIPPQSSVVWTAGTIIRVVNYGAGTVTFAGGSGVTVTNTAATLAQYQSAALIRTASDAWTVVPFSGGASKATVTATTGSPTVDTTSRPGKTIYIFDGSGSLTVGTAGTCEVLVVGGGGGGGNDPNNNTVNGGGGGGGGVISQTSLYVASAGTYTVTVGGGGAANANEGGNDSAIVGLVTAVGGGTGGMFNATGVLYGPRKGGSGGGGCSYSNAIEYTGAGAVVSQGYAGGNGYTNLGAANGAGGGGGGSAVGGAGTTSVGGAGGAGYSSSITGSSVSYAGGGGGARNSGSAGAGGAGGGGKGQDGTAAVAGQANTGGGGGGAYQTNVPGNGGSGKVIVVIG